MNASSAPPEHWEVATQWRDGGTPISTKSTVEEAKTEETAGENCTGAGHEKESQGEQEQHSVVSVGFLRTCFSDVYGSHIPRMFRDLLLDVSQAFLAAAAAENTVHEAAAGFEEHATPPNPVDVSGGSSCGGWSGDGGSGPSRRSGRSGTARAPALVFHVTEYDVTRLRFPPKWENHAGYIIPGGVASACGKEPWMLTLLDEVKGLRETGRPVLGICLGHQVLAQGLGGLVQPRTAPGRHYALQESELLLLPCPAGGAVIDAIATVQGEKRNGKRGGNNGETEGERGEGDGEKGVASAPLRPQMPLRLLYHHNDEVVKLPPGATNISTSRPCEIHGMMMMRRATAGAEKKETAEEKETLPSSFPSAAMGVTGTGTETKATAIPSAESSTLNLLTFQAHPELNYEYGRTVMNGMLDNDVALGRLTHEEASAHKAQVLAWDHEEFPVAIELMRRLFAPIVPRRLGGCLQ